MKVVMVVDTEASPECLAWGHQKKCALQWYIPDKPQNRSECGLEELHVFPPWVERHGHEYDRVEVFDSQ